ncbi:MAG: 3-deoxy-manno-octulosonate cytidylyltransferase [Flavobacteriaceae bacterium]|nr:3-deoxy-manno-octulosonate cytidylyltransferase [Flavobacteriaceae bacterium]
MKIIAMIPARFEATRFPGKLMKDLGGKTVISRTYEAVKSTNLFDDVYVVSDSSIIFEEIKNHGGKVLMSKKSHESGSDRIAEAIADLDIDIVINVQGDEPFTQKEPLEKLIEVFKNDAKKEVDVASLMFKINDKIEINNPNNVKVVVDKANFAMYFSRAPIPYPRDEQFGIYYKHIGIYAFRKEALLEISKMPVTQLEATEKLENLRFLENQKKIKMVLTTHTPIGIDTEADLESARRYLLDQTKNT